MNKTEKLKAIRDYATSLGICKQCFRREINNGNVKCVQNLPDKQKKEIIEEIKKHYPKPVLQNEEEQTHHTYNDGKRDVIDNIIDKLK